jgi:hypothetical protein
LENIRRWVMANEFETILTKVGKDIVKVENALSNVITMEKPVLTAYLPAATVNAIETVNTLFQNTMVTVEAKYAAIGASSVSYAQKVLEVVAISGAAAASILTQAGYTVGTTQLQQIATGATTVYNILGTPGLTTLPAAPATSTATSAVSAAVVVDGGKAA